MAIIAILALSLKMLVSFVPSCQAEELTSKSLVWPA